MFVRPVIVVILCLASSRVARSAAVTVGGGPAGPDATVVVSSPGRALEQVGSPSVEGSPSTLIPISPGAPSLSPLGVPATSGGLPVPEPVTLAIFGTGLLLLFRKRTN